MAPPREVDIKQLRPLRQRRSERAKTPEDKNAKPQFSDRHFWGMGSWGKRAGKWGEGPRMGGPNPWWTVAKLRIRRALGLAPTPDPLASRPPPPSLRVKIENLFTSVRTLKDKRHDRRENLKDERHDQRENLKDKRHDQRENGGRGAPP